MPRKPCHAAGAHFDRRQLHRSAPIPTSNGVMSISRIRLLALAVVTAAIPLLPTSAGAQGRLRGAIRFGGEYGGDKVLQFTYEDGSTPDVIAGGGLLLTAGGALGLYTRGAHAVDAQLNVGLKYRTIPPASNQEVTWLRFPVEGLLYYRTPVGIRIGAGATVHLRNVMEASGAVLNERVEFENKPGFLVQAEYVRKNVAFDLRYTAMEYELSSGGSGTVDASSIGVGITFFIGNSRPKP